MCYSILGRLSPQSLCLSGRTQAGFWHNVPARRRYCVFGFEGNRLHLAVMAVVAVVAVVPGLLEAYAAQLAAEL